MFVELSLIGSLDRPNPARAKNETDRRAAAEEEEGKGSVGCKAANFNKKSKKVGRKAHTHLVLKVFNETLGEIFKCSPDRK